MQGITRTAVALVSVFTLSGIVPPAVSGLAGVATKKKPAVHTGQEVAEEPVRRAILIGWDGADRDRIREYMKAGDLPALQGLADRGTIVSIDILRTTDTKAGWTQILTGYEPEKTGVFNNWRYRPIPRGYTVFERLKEVYGPDFLTIAVIGKHNNLGCEGPKMIPSSGKKKPKKVKDQNKEIKIVEKEGKKYESIPGKPYFFTAKSMDVFENGLRKDKKVGTRALELLDQHHHEDFFIFVHFAEIDTKGHHTGEGSAKQRQAYISADTWTGRILERLEELGIADETYVYVTSDHGFDKGQKQHKDAPYVFLATNDPNVVRRGERADIAPTMLESLGIDPSTIDPPLDGHPLSTPYEPPRW
jgi:hypothetical protein